MPVLLPAEGSYVTDGKRLLQVVEVSSGGEVVLEDCAYPADDSRRVRISEAKAAELQTVRAA